MRPQVPPPRPTLLLPPHRPRLLYLSVTSRDSHYRRIHPPPRHHHLHQRATIGCQTAAAGSRAIATGSQASTTGSPPLRHRLSLSLSLSSWHHLTMNVKVMGCLTSAESITAYATP
jgi:hypothetical protein